MKNEVLEFDPAFLLVKNFYSFCDRHSMDMWANFKDEIKDGIEKYKNAEAYKSEFAHRTDLSDDDKWELESLEGGIDILFAIIYGSPQPTERGEE